MLPASMATTNGRLIPLEELELLEDEDELELLDELLELDDVLLEEDELLEDELLDEVELLEELEDPSPLQPTSAKVVIPAKSQPPRQPFIFIFFIDAFRIDSKVEMVLQIHSLPRYLIPAP